MSGERVTQRWRAVSLRADSSYLICILVQMMNNVCQLLAQSAMASMIHSYHCICSTLVLTSAARLEALPCRSGLDHAYALSLPTALAPASNLMSTELDPQPCIVESDSGFEKRFWQRCTRCRLTIGYWLDWAQYDDGNGGGNSAANVGRRDDVFFVLPGGLRATDVMVAGK